MWTMIPVTWLWLFLLGPHRIQSSGGKKSRELRIGLTRQIRSLGFPEGSGMGIFFAVAIPIDIPDKSISLSWYFEANYPLPAANSSILEGAYIEQEPTYRRKRSVDRRLVYDVIQSKLESMGYPGKACLLRTICEAARFPFDHNGLVGDVVRIIFTPSSSQKEDLDPEIEEAEYQTECQKYHETCPISILDTFEDRGDYDTRPFSYRRKFPNAPPLYTYFFAYWQTEGFMTILETGATMYPTTNGFLSRISFPRSFRNFKEKSRA